jgi:hypothetical protein
MTSDAPDDLPAMFVRLTDVDAEAGELDGLLHGITVDDAGGVTVLAFAGDVSPEQIHGRMHQAIADLGVREVIYGLDRWAKPGQSVDTASLVTVYWWRREHNGFFGWEFGVLPYDKDGLRPLQWDNPFWKPLMRGEIEALMGAAQKQMAWMMPQLGLSEADLPELLRRARALGRQPTVEDITALVREIGGRV